MSNPYFNYVVEIGHNGMTYKTKDFRDAVAMAEDSVKRNVTAKIYKLVYVDGELINAKK